MADEAMPPVQTARFHAVVRGRVQGVGFRFSAAARAKQLGVCGYVKNQADGSVAVEATGARDALDAFLVYLHEGPGMARVTSVDVTWQNPSDAEVFTAFSAR
jgi:acylphosphatase